MVQWVIPFLQGHPRVGLVTSLIWRQREGRVTVEIPCLASWECRKARCRRGVMRDPPGAAKTILTACHYRHFLQQIIMASTAGPRSIHYGNWVSSGTQIRGAGSIPKGLSGGCPELRDHGRIGPSFLHWNELVLLIVSSAIFAHLPTHCKPQL